MTWLEILVLIVSGVFVGFINTLAGGGSIISLSVLMILGLPANVANGTNRIGIIVQTVTAAASFKQQKVLDAKKGIKLAIPAVVGSLIGAWIAVDINEEIFEKAIAVIMLVMLIFILYKPQKYLYGRKDLQEKKVGITQIVVFFLIGVYGGFIHMGVGYFLLMGLVLTAGYDLVKANAVKVLIAGSYSIVSFFIFIYNGQVEWMYGLMLTIGTFMGAFIASRMAVKKGINFVRWVIVVVILLTSAHLFNIIDIKAFFDSIL